jgi:hypothetical protein
MPQLQVRIEQSWGCRRRCNNDWRRNPAALGFLLLLPLQTIVAAVLDQAVLQISLEREVSQPRTPLLLLPERCATPSPAWRWLWTLPLWPGGLAAIYHSCRSCNAGCGAPSRAAPPAFPAAPMPITSSSWAAGIGRSKGALMR